MEPIQLVIDDEHELRILHSMLMEAKFSVSASDTRLGASPFSSNLIAQTLETLLLKQAEQDPSKPQSWSTWLEKKKPWIWERSLAHFLKNPPYRWNEVDLETKCNHVKWALSPYQPTENDLYEFINEYQFYYDEIMQGKEVWLRKLGYATQDMLEQLENKMDAPFPDDYKAFLLQYNGGTPLIHYCTFSIEELREVIPLEVLYGIGLNGRYDLEYQNSFAEDRPSGYIAIGESAGGGKLLLGYTQENQGVYYWSSLHQDDPACEQTLYKLADHFHSFMSSWKRMTKSI
ncbi:SMI1/KNR4 family protein [Paenibacillus sp. WLX2291]|uniref:SMI1/KNR4 family protein n=1 Tax=Paenibacillus sp. WLX2291 TaxID=3296934 RepID=UPI003984055A